MPPCAVCPNETTYGCSACKAVLFCSRACQKLIWPSHRLLCKLDPHLTWIPDLSSLEREFVMRLINESSEESLRYQTFLKDPSKLHFGGVDFFELVHGEEVSRCLLISESRVSKHTRHRALLVLHAALAGLVMDGQWKWPDQRPLHKSTRSFQMISILEIMTHERYEDEHTDRGEPFLSFEKRTEAMDNMLRQLIIQLTLQSRMARCKTAESKADVAALADLAAHRIAWEVQKIHSLELKKAVRSALIDLHAEMQLSKAR